MTRRSGLSEIETRFGKMLRENRRKAGYSISGLAGLLEMKPVQNFDISVAKIVPFRDRYAVEFRVDMYNTFNHPQYTPGRPSRVNAVAHAGETNYLTPGNAEFRQWDRVYSSNPRQIQLTAKFRF